MPSYLLDVNLPGFFGPWQPPEFMHVIDLNRRWSDLQIWEYAEMHSLTIVSKDRDYFEQMLLQEPPPRVIHLRIGNIRLKNFQAFFEKNWKDIAEISEQHKLVMVYEDQILWMD